MKYILALIKLTGREKIKGDGKSILIIGGGFGQIPAILAAKSIGLKTIVADQNQDAVGMQFADLSLNVNTLDVENIIKAASDNNVAGVMTMQSDVGVPTVGAVVDALGLPGSGFEVAKRCSNKILTRQALAQSLVSQPRFSVVASVAEAIEAAKQIGYPCVVKAPDSSGSRGVVKASSLTDVGPAFYAAKQFTRGDFLLVEEYVHGIEVGAQAFSSDGRCRLVLVHDDELSHLPFMIPVAHAFPSTLPISTRKHVEATVSACVDALGISDGPSNIDLIIDHDWVPRIIEVGARIGATCLPELVKYHTGIDWTLAAVLASIGADYDLTVLSNQPCAAFILDSPEDGVLKGVTLAEKWKRNPDVLEWEVTARLGDKVSRLRNGTDRIGKVVTKGVTAKQALKLGRSFKNAIKFEVA